MSFDVQTPKLDLSGITWTTEEAAASARYPKLRDGMTCLFRITGAEIRQWPKTTDYSQQGDLFVEVTLQPVDGEGNLVKQFATTIVGLPFKNPTVDGHVGPRKNSWTLANFMNAIMPNEYEAFPKRNSGPEGGYTSSRGEHIEKKDYESYAATVAEKAGVGFIQNFLNDIDQLANGGYEPYGTTAVKADGRVRVNGLCAAVKDGVTVETTNFVE